MITTYNMEAYRLQFNAANKINLKINKINIIIVLHSQKYKTLRLVRKNLKNNSELKIN